jgi:hypothetical protein
VVELCNLNAWYRADAHRGANGDAEAPNLGALAGHYRLICRSNKPGVL